MFEKIQRKLYDKSQIDFNDLLFTTKGLWILLIPIIIEQFLNALMGMVDSMMVSNVGSAAISAVSLVDSINVLVIQVFGAMATGATIICSQYIGKRDKEKANQAAQQVFLTMVTVSVAMMLGMVLLREPLLRMIFGEVEQDVMDHSMIYYFITVLSYPFIALFNSGASFYRASGESKFPMKVSVLSNILNVGGNALFIFVLDMGVAGAALSTLLSRGFCAIVLFYYLRKPKQVIVMREYFRIKPNFKLIGMILAIGIPAGIENGMFQFGKLAIQSTVSQLGTTAIAAQAITNILEVVNGMAGVGVGIGLMTVVGQCMGAGRKEEAKYYIVKLTVYAEAIIIASCLFTILITQPVIYLAGMEPESARMCWEMMIAITIVKPVAWVLAFVPAYGMRAAGDVKFCMIVSTVTMWTCRVAVSVYLCRFLKIGPMGVWIGMFMDWSIRSLIFAWRYKSNKWMHNHVIEEELALEA